MPDDDGEDSGILEQFERLMDELLRGGLRRACFRPWEIEILLDLAACEVHSSVLHHYRAAVVRQLRSGARRPMKLSEYLAGHPPGDRSF